MFSTHSNLGAPSKDAEVHDVQIIKKDCNDSIDNFATKSIAKTETSSTAFKPLSSGKLAKNNKLPLIKPLATAMYYCGITSPENDDIPTACLKHLKSTRHKTKSNGFRWQRSVVRKWVDDVSFREEVKQELVKLLKNGKRESSNNRRKKTSIKPDNVSANEKYCVCKNPDDGSLYVFCQTCSLWLHPKCVFDDDDLALTLTRQQWNKCNLACKDKKDQSVDEEKQTLYHIVRLTKHCNSSDEKECNSYGNKTNESDFNESNPSRRISQATSFTCSLVKEDHNSIQPNINKENDFSEVISDSDNLSQNVSRGYVSMQTASSTGNDKVKDVSSKVTGEEERKDDSAACLQ